jgi:subtilisin family serine protease
MTELAAIALSQDPKVKLVEQDQILHIQSTQTGAPWDLDRIDEMTRTLQGDYTYNATGDGVVAYVLDTGIRATHNDFGSRASNAADFVNESGCTGTNNDCSTYGHGTAVASVLGGSTYGVSKCLTVKSVKVCDTSGGCSATVVAAGLDWVIGDHGDSDIAVVNMSIGDSTSSSIDNWTQFAIDAGITCVAAAGNGNYSDIQNHSSPGRVPEALTVGASDYYDSRWINSGSSGSNYGSLVDIFAPGFGNVAACNTSNSCVGEVGATSGASPIGAGLAALYLEGRTGMSGCAYSPISDPANTSGGAVSTCPDRVNQFIKSNATLSQLSSIPSGTANRLSYTRSLPTNANPIDNQRFFVWQQYSDFLSADPDESGLDYWTNGITGTCSTGFNDNDSCTHTWRVLDSRAFWVATHGSWFNGSYGLQSGYNGAFVTACYQIYLRRDPDTDGYNYWLNELSTNYGDPANSDGVLHLIDAFLSSGVPDGYRQRFGAP